MSEKSCDSYDKCGQLSKDREDGKRICEICENKDMFENPPVEMVSVKELIKSHTEMMVFGCLGTSPDEYDRKITKLSTEIVTQLHALGYYKLDEVEIDYDKLVIAMGQDNPSAPFALKAIMGLMAGEVVKANPIKPKSVSNGSEVGG